MPLTIRLFALAISAVIVGLASGCGGAMESSSKYRGRASDATDSASGQPMANHSSGNRSVGLTMNTNAGSGERFASAMDGEPGADPDPGSDPDPQTAPARVMVYTASLDLVVRDAAAAPSTITALVEQFRGYVQSRSMAYVVVRVPSAGFDAFLAALADVGNVRNEQVVAQDVTEQFVDLLARLRSAEGVQARLRALLERAENVEAALRVEQELKRVDQLVEQLKGQLQVLQNRVAFSTITIRLAETERPAPIQVRNFGELPFEWLRQLNPNHLWD